MRYMTPLGVKGHIWVEVRGLGISEAHHEINQVTTLT